MKNIISTPNIGLYSIAGLYSRVGSVAMLAHDLNPTYIRKHKIEIKEYPKEDLGLSKVKEDSTMKPPLGRSQKSHNIIIGLNK